MSIYFILSIAFAIAATPGYMMVLKKCGVDKKIGLIPIYRTYQLARLSGSEDVGIAWALSFLLSEGLDIVLERMEAVTPDGDLPLALSLAVVAEMLFELVAIMYEVRIYLFACRHFARSRWWTVPWILVPCIPATIWGFFDEYLPVDYYDEEDEEESGQAAEESGHIAETIAEGLTVNLKKRTVIEKGRRVILLKDIHMNITPGKMVLLLGGSGAGKTTFINALIGYEKADAQITLNGYDVYKDYDKMKYEIGMVPQMDLMRYEDSVYMTLMDAAVLRLPEEVTFGERRKRVEEVLEIFGLSSVKSSQVGKLSGGQKKRLSIAMEFICDPTLFVLDEPDSGLDGILARDLMERLHKISREGKIVIVITHSPDRVKDLFDDVIVLAKDADKVGRLVYYGSIEKAKTFFKTAVMEKVIKIINRSDEGGEGRADELIAKFGKGRNEQE